MNLSVFFYSWFPATVIKLVPLFYKSVNKPLKDYILDRRLNLNLESWYFKSFRSSLQSQHLWVTMFHHNSKWSICIDGNVWFTTVPFIALPDQEKMFTIFKTLISIEAGGLSTILTSAFLLQKNIQEWSDLNTFKSRITARYIIDKKKVSRVSLRTCQVQIKYRVINMDIYWRIRFRLCYYKDLFTHKDINTYINGVV